MYSIGGVFLSAQMEVTSVLLRSVLLIPLPFRAMPYFVIEPGGKASRFSPRRARLKLSVYFAFLIGVTL